MPRLPVLAWWLGVADLDCEVGLAGRPAGVEAAQEGGAGGEFGGQGDSSVLVVDQQGRITCASTSNATANSATRSPK